MSLVLDPAALERVLHSPLGMVGVYVHRKAEPIRDKIAGNAGDYFGSAPTLAAGVSGDVSLHMDGSTAVIAINPSGTGRKWDRLIRKARDGSWMGRPEIILQESKF